MSAAMNSIIKYTNEPLMQKGTSVLTAQEFRKFLGMLPLTSDFNTSVSTTWEIMATITGDQVMIHERYVQVMSNLRGYDNHSHIIMTSIFSWIDQRSTLECSHVLEKKYLKEHWNFSSMTTMGVMCWMMS
jgi:hypothetical protein